MRFADNGDGTATISGTPSHRAVGVYPLTLTAKNKNGTATQAFTLTVTRAPAIQKIPATTAGVGVPLHLAVRATGYPVPALAESGPLPVGLSFTDSGNGTTTIAGTAADGSGGALLRCGIPRQRPRMIRMLCGSDRGCEAVKGDPEPVAGRDVGGDLVAAAAQVLDEGMTGGQDPR